MSEIHPPRLAFDRGIDSITYARDETASFMPERDNTPPPGMAVRSELDALLNKPTIDDYLNAALRPDLVNRDLLLPRFFLEALAATRKKLRQATENVADSSEDFQVLNRAQRLLAEETNLRDLLLMYRSALYQG